MWEAVSDGRPKGLLELGVGEDNASHILVAAGDSASHFRTTRQPLQISALVVANLSSKIGGGETPLGSAFSKGGPQGGV